MQILSQEAALRKLQRMAYEIAEQNLNEEEIVLAGIKENGIIIARILASLLKPLFSGTIRMMEVEINKKNPREVKLISENTISLDNCVVIITDDVSNSGKTLSYALKPFLSYYPSKIQTLVLVERSYKRFPVSPDFKGLSVATALSERIVVETKNNEVTAAYLEV